MKEFENNAYFWQKVDAAYLSGDYKTIYKKGECHPQYKDLVFPADYGHIFNGGEETSMRIFKGKGSKTQSVVVCANLLEKDLTTIVLVGLNESEEEEVLKFLNSTDFQKTIVIRRGKDIPSWAVTE